MMNNRDLVNLIIKRGWSIFPCAENKQPLTKAGFKDATTNKTRIIEWFELYGNFKIGIPCSPNYFFAVDVDPDGIETWEGWITEFGGAGNGPRQHTPRGGMHILYKLPAEVKIPNTAGKLSPGIDLRSNGYICTGSGYSWEENENSVQAPLCSAPDWLLEKIKVYNAEKEHSSEGIEHLNFEDTDPDRVGNYWLEKALSSARPGNRNQTGFDLACQLRDSRLSRSQAESIMRAYASRVPKCDDPYTSKEAIASLKEAYSAAPREPAHFKTTNKKIVPAPPAETVNQLPGQPGEQVARADSTEGMEEVPLGLILTAKEVAQLDRIAIQLRLPRHQVLADVVRKFMDEFDKNNRR